MSQRAGHDPERAFPLSLGYSTLSRDTYIHRDCIRIFRSVPVEIRRAQCPQPWSLSKNVQ
jgi:hypothetical protein